MKITFPENRRPDASPTVSAGVLPAESSAFTGCPGLYGMAASGTSHVDLLAGQPQVVFVVCDGEYEDYEIKGVFSTFKKAREFQEEHDFEHMEFHVLDDGLFDYETRMLFVIKINEKGKGIIEEYNYHGVLVGVDTVSCSFLPDVSQPVVYHFVCLHSKQAAEIVAEGLYAEWQEGQQE